MIVLILDLSLVAVFYRTLDFFCFVWFQDNHLHETKRALQFKYFRFYMLEQICGIKSPLIKYFIFCMLKYVCICKNISNPDLVVLYYFSCDRHQKELFRPLSLNQIIWFSECRAEQGQTYWTGTKITALSNAEEEGTIAILDVCYFNRIKFHQS